MQAGTGATTYQWTDGWAKLPTHIQTGYTHGVVADRHDNIYVFNQSPHAMLRFDHTGRFMDSWGEEFAAGAHGLVINEEDGEQFLYLVSQGKPAVLVKTTLEGEELLRIGCPPRDDIYTGEKKFIPTDCAVAVDGTVYLTDGYGQAWVHRFTPDGQYVDSFGGKGEGDGQLRCPHGIAIDCRRGGEELYVADRGNHRIQVFDLEGRFLRKFDHEMRQPCGFDFHEDLMLVPDLHSRVSIFDANDQHVTHLFDGGPIWETEGWPNIPHAMRKPGVFSSPHFGCFNSRGDIFIVEWVSDGRITKLARRS